MPRQARQKEPFSIYLVKQHCRHTNMFDSEAEKQHFLASIIEAQRQYDFLVLALTLSATMYQLIVFDNGSDISKIMKSINIGYAFKVQRDAFKLTQRFQSSIIRSHDTLIALLDARVGLKQAYKNQLMRSNAAVNTTRFYKHFYSERQSFIDLLEHSACLLPCKDERCHKAINCTDDCIRTKTDAQAFIDKSLQSLNISFDDMLADKKLRNRLIIDLRKRSVLTLKEIGQTFGGIGESAISKIIKRQSEKNGGYYELNI